MLRELTAGAILKSTAEWAFGLARLLWVSFVLPAPWFWVIVAALLVVMRLLPARARH